GRRSPPRPSVARSPQGPPPPLTALRPAEPGGHPAGGGSRRWAFLTSTLSTTRQCAAGRAPFSRGTARPVAPLLLGFYHPDGGTPVAAVLHLIHQGVDEIETAAVVGIALWVREGIGGGNEPFALIPDGDDQPRGLLTDRELHLVFGAARRSVPDRVA